MSDALFPHYPHIAARLFNTPLLVEAGKLRAIAHGLAPRIGVQLLGLPPAPHAQSKERPRVEKKPYQIVNGIGVIPVFGGLVHRAGQIDADSMPLTSYDGLGKLFDAALQDPDVSSILFHIDSPGGEAQGVFDLADKILTVQTDKPIVAFADMAASAAYLIGSSADQFFVSQSAMVGSIGVRMLHVDQSRMNDAMGLTVTEIFAGARKADGTPHAPLTEASMIALQGRIDDLYDLFVDAVAKNRGITTAVIRGTEAGIFLGAKAQPLGLIDGIRTLDQLLAFPGAPVGAAVLTITTKSEERKEDRMEKFENVAALQAAYSELTAEIRKEAVTAERARIKGILTRAPKGQETLARKLAFEDSCSPGDAALQFLDAQETGKKTQLAGFLSEAPAAVDPMLNDKDTNKPDHIAAAQSVNEWRQKRMHRVK